MRLISDAGSDLPHARRLHLRDAPARRTGSLVLQNERLALQDCALVGNIEELANQRQANAIHDSEVLGNPQVELVDVLEADVTDRIEDDVDSAAGVEAGNGVTQCNSIALPRIEIHAEVDVPWEYIRGCQVRLPLCVDEIVAERTRASGLRGVLASRASARTRRTHRNCGKSRRRIRETVFATLLGVVVEARVGTHHPPVRKALRRCQLEPAELLRVIRTRGELSVHR